MTCDHRSAERQRKLAKRARTYSNRVSVWFRDKHEAHAFARQMVKAGRSVCLHYNAPVTKTRTMSAGTRKSAAA